MYTQENNFSLNILSKILNAEIHYFSLCKKKKLTSINQKQTINKLYSEEILFICGDSVKFIGEKYSKIKREFLFTNVSRIIISNKGDVILTSFYLKKGIKSKSKNQYTFIVSNSKKLIEVLSKETKIYFIKKNNLTSEIPIIFPELAINNNINIETPKDHKIYFQKNYKYYLDNLFINSNKDNINFIYSNNNSKIEITINIKEEQPIETISINSDLESLKIYSYNAFNNYIKNILLLKNNFYIKPVVKINKYPSDINDTSLWKCYLYSLKTKCINNIGYNLLFFYIRRNFIPPFFESYTDIIITLKENYKDNNYQSTNFSKFALISVKNLFTSLSSDDVQNMNIISNKIVTEKLEAYLIYSKNISYLYKDLNIFGNNSYKLVIAYKTKLILMYQEYEKQLNKNFIEDIKTANKIINIDESDFDNDKYIEKIKSMSTNEIIEKFLSTMKNSLYKTEIAYKNKLLKFLGDVLLNKKFYKTTSGENFFNALLDLALRNEKFKKNIYPEFKRLINLTIINYKEEILVDQNIYDIIINKNDIFLLTYNAKFLIFFMKKGILSDIFEIQNEVIFYQFLYYILKYNFSIKLLIAIYYYLDSFIKNNKNLISSIEKISEILLPLFINLYNNESLIPDVTIYSCKCLILLSNNDLNIRNKLTNLKFISIIYYYLSLPSIEQIFFNSLKLLQSLTKDSSNLVKIIDLKKEFL